MIVETAGDANAGKPFSEKLCTVPAVPGLTRSIASVSDRMAISPFSKDDNASAPSSINAAAIVIRAMTLNINMCVSPPATLVDLKTPVASELIVAIW